MEVSNEVVIQNPERRCHERINDEIVMFWREVKPGEISEETGNDREANPDEISEEVSNYKAPAADFSLSSQIRLLSLETSGLLKRIGLANPLLVEYLTALERKVDALASALIVKDNFTYSRSTRHVNLSVSGLAFLTEQEYSPGTLLELEMVFLPTLTSVIVYGRVIYCIRYENDKLLSHRIGVGFIRLHDYDREMLTGHVNSRLSQGKETRETH